MRLLKDGQDRSQGGGLAAASRRFFTGIREVGSDRRIVLTSVMEGMANLSVGALRALIAGGLVVSAASFAVIPTLRGLWPLLVTTACFGFGEALVTSSGAAFVADLCNELHFGTAIRTFGTIFDVGHASGPILAGVLIARFDYTTSFLILAGLLVLAVPVFLVGVPKTPKNAT